MFNQNAKRIGFACKYMHPDQTQKPKILKEIQSKYTERSTTITWLNRQTRDVAEQRLYEIAFDNVANLERLIRYVGSLPEQLRMVRLGSNLLPAYTHGDWAYFYRDPSLQARLERAYSSVGEIARELDVRLSMHPGQFTVLASDSPDIVNRSIEEFEYHADIIRWMGYGKDWQDFKCNVHISGRQGPAGIKAILPRLSTEARNTITIENDENKWGLADSLELEKDVALVLDIHHHLCRENEYILPTDDRFKRVIDSWRGVRPAIHYSYSREEWVGHIDTNTKPDFPALLEQGYKKGKLRAHSDYYPNNATNDWALSFLPDADIMCEAKMKNLASDQLLQRYIINNNTLTGSIAA